LYPKTLTQLCIVHLVRASLRYVTAGDSKAVVAMLKAIYQPATMDGAERELLALEAVCGDKYQAVIRLWRNNWDNIIPFFQFPPEIRKITYTTNAIESLNANLRKLTRNRRIFPNDESVFKAMYLAIWQCADKWSIIHHWKPALQVFQIVFGEDRIPLNELRTKTL
jgi:transposase-like protein